MKLLATLLNAPLFILILAAQARAQVTTISQPTKFPIEIKARGSYRLIGNLKVLSPNKTAINITAVGPVTIDLNGFAILGPAVCSGAPATCAPAGSGIGINGGPQSIVSVFNGTVTGMGGTGISLGAMARVRDVSAIGNGGSGVITGANSIVSESGASSNGADGIAPGANSVVIGCAASANGGTGIYAEAPGVTVSTTATAGNKEVGILAETVTGSSADSNLGKGIEAPTVAFSTADSNTTLGIMAITATGSTMQFNQGDGFGGFLLTNSSSSANGGYGLAGFTDFAFDLFSTNTAGSRKAADNQLGTSDCSGTVPCP